MSSSSSSSQSQPSSSSSSSSVSCQNKCLWKPINDEVTGEVIGWEKLCHGCDENSYCPAPGITVAPHVPGARASVETSCFPFNGGGSSSTGTMAFAKASELPAVATAPYALLRVPNVSQPRVWTTSMIPLTAPWIVHVESGWRVTFMKVSGGPATPLISPATLPADEVRHTDKVLAASIILPSASGPRQYWVPVTERNEFLGYRFAQLATEEWTLFFLREPL